jgi:hypothetical protein
LEIQELINNKPREFFGFDNHTPEEIVFRFNLFVRRYFPKFFNSSDAPFHKKIDIYNARIWLGEISSFLNIAFRGASKTTRTKLFIAFAILNDRLKRKKYIKVLCREATNSAQFTTDIYNLLITVSSIYPNTFKKSALKREETMSGFTTNTSIKVQAGTIGSSQRGDVQDEARPDVIVFDDFEDRLTLRSAVITKTIWDTMEEARTGLSKDGSSIYLANYISEQGNVHKLVEKIENKIIIPIIENGVPTWNRYSVEDINLIKKEADDFEGEYLCKPNASKDIYFDREILEKMEVRQPIKEVAGFKIYKQYDSSHRYAGGQDVAGGVGLDSSASAFIDFSTIPAQVVGTFHSNTILPEAFGDEIYAEANIFGGCLVAPENNKYDQTILKAKQLGAKLYTHPKGKTAKTIYQGNPTYQYGWETNSLTKSKMMADFRKAVNDGLVALNDLDLIKEAKAYTRNDLIDKSPDPRDVSISTRHFDILTACAIAWQMKDLAEANQTMSPFIEIGITQEELSNNPAE